MNNFKGFVNVGVTHQKVGEAGVRLKKALAAKGRTQFVAYEVKLSDYQTA